MSGARRLHFGIQARLVTALVVTGAVTLAVAAVALVSPLTARLRSQQVQSTSTDMIEARAQFQSLPAAQWRSGSPELTELARGLRRRTASHLVVAQRGVILYDSDPDLHDTWQTVAPVAARALVTHHTSRVDANIGGGDFVRVASPVDSRRGRVLIATKPLSESHAAASVVDGALVTTGLAGIVTALLLGLLFGRGLSRRLRALDATAEDISIRGLEASVPADRTRDEIGALSRTFAQMQARLRQQEEARRTFVATASHELRTPLMSLHGTLELLDESLVRHGGPDDARFELERARRQCAKLESLAAGLLDLSRIDAGVELRSEPVELGLLARAAISEMSSIAAARDIDLTIDLPEDQVWAMCDPTGAIRVLRILLDNALRVVSSGGHVAVRVSRGDAATVIVEDDGPGIPAHERELIFERFRRGEGAGIGGGFGLGLAIGVELASIMDGSLRLVSPQGRGASFELSLPIADRALEAV